GSARSRRIGRPLEWPGLEEPGKRPRPRAGGASCCVASTVNSSCAHATTTAPKHAIAIILASNFNRCSSRSSDYRRRFNANSREVGFSENGVLGGESDRESGINRQYRPHCEPNRCFRKVAVNTNLMVRRSLQFGDA